MGVDRRPVDLLGEDCLAIIGRGVRSRPLCTDIAGMAGHPLLELVDAVGVNQLRAAGHRCRPGYSGGNRLLRKKASHIKTCWSLTFLRARAARRTACQARGRGVGWWAVIEITTFRVLPMAGC